MFITYYAKNLKMFRHVLCLKRQTITLSAKYNEIDNLAGTYDAGALSTEDLFYIKEIFMTVYVDVLLIINFMIDFVLLRLAALFSGKRLITGRALLAAGLGALSSLVIFIPFNGFLKELTVKILVSVLIILVAHRWNGIRTFLKDAFCLFAVSFLFSGAMMALYMLRLPEGMAVYHGVVYFDINAVILLFTTAACYLMTGMLSKLLLRRAPKDSLCEVRILTNNGICTMTALIDTGSNLSEPFSGGAVMVCGKKSLEKVLPKEIKEFSFESPSDAVGIRLVPYRSLKGSGLLPAFMPLDIDIKNESFHCKASEGSYIAVSPDTIGNDMYDAIMNPAMISGKRNEVKIK